MRTSGFLMLAAAVLAFSALPASADDTGNIYVSFGGTGSGSAQQITHDDADPWKGWAYINAQNSGDTAWGDFHFEIVDVGYDVTNVDWVVTDPYEPVTSMTLDSTTVDNSAYGATLDFEFYGDAVQPGDTASFSLYTDNTVDQVNQFGVLFYPTPVPEPTTMAVLAVGGLAVALRPRKKRA